VQMPYDLVLTHLGKPIYYKRQKTSSQSGTTEMANSSMIRFNDWLPVETHSDVSLRHIGPACEGYMPLVLTRDRFAICRPIIKTQEGQQSWLWNP